VSLSGQGLGLKLPFALRYGRVVEPHEVPNGRDCGCQCPGCRRPLIAYNQGRKRVPHFGHAPGQDCGRGALESALHLAAKQVLREAAPGDIRLPATVVRADGLARPLWQGERWIDPGRHLPQQIVCDARTAALLRVEEEPQVRLQPPDLLPIAPVPQGSLFKNPPSRRPRSVRTLRPDVIAYEADGSLWLEILVTHAVGEPKQALLQSHGWRALEIDLRPWMTRPVTLADLRHSVLEAFDGKRWLSYPGASEAASQVRAIEAERQEKIRQGSARQEMLADAGRGGTSSLAKPEGRRDAEQKKPPDFSDEIRDPFALARLRQEVHRSQRWMLLTYEQWCQEVREERSVARAVMVGSVRVFPEFGALPDRATYSQAQASGREAVERLSLSATAPYRWFGGGRIGATPQETVRGQWLDGKSWPPLKGSPRQLAWAESIRRKYLFANPADVASVSISEAGWWIQNWSRLGKP
jgi:hypothetical protein